MSIKPTGNLPLWATSGTKVEPGSGQKATGWTFGQIPPSSFENWRAGKVGEWLSYLSDLTSGVDITDLVIRMAQTSAAEGSTPLVVASSAEAGGTGNTWKPLMRFAAGAGRGVRLFSGSLSTTAFAIAVNATWTPGNPGTWTQELSGQGSAIIAVNGTGITFARKASGTSPWASWGSDVSIVGGDVSVTNLTASAAVNASTANISGTASVNTLSASGLVTGADGIFTDDLTVGDDATVGGTLVVTGGIESSANIVAGGGYLLSGTHLVTKQIGPAQMLITGSAEYIPGTDYIQGSASGVGSATCYLDIPNGQDLIDLRVQIDQPTTNTMSVTVIRVVQGSWLSTPSGAPVVNSADLTGANAATGLTTVVFSPISDPDLSNISNPTTRYKVSVFIEQNTAARVYGLRYVCQVAEVTNA